MQIPDFDKEEIPSEMIDRVGEDFEIVPLNEQSEYEPQISPERSSYLDRKILKQMDELNALKKVYDKDKSKKENWKKVKKVARYFKSPLYEVRSLDRSTSILYNTDSPDGGDTKIQGE